MIQVQFLEQGVLPPEWVVATPCSKVGLIPKDLCLYLFHFPLSKGGLRGIFQPVQFRKISPNPSLQKRGTAH